MFSRRTQLLHTPPTTVGAGLPAIAVCHSTEMLKLMASSLASQLPRGHQGSQNRSSPEIKTVGAGLPAMAVCHSTEMLKLMASSLASQLPRGHQGSQNRSSPEIKTVGASLLAKAVCQSRRMLTLTTPSRAGSLPHVFASDTTFAHAANHCGSGLARDGGVSFDRDVEADGLIAGKPAPTGFCCG